jgi:ubiquinone/menaquinone biosynthesis C-methylase UbiE
MDKEYVKYLLEKTRKDYDQIAESFSKTREYIPEEQKSLLLQYITPGDKVLDLGCGNGRFSEVFKQNIEYIGVDSSRKMIEIAKTKYPEADFKVTDALNLPFPENSFDKVFSFAVIHHIPSEELQLQFLKEVKRTLKPGGILILAAWNLNPLRMILIGQYKRVKDFFKHQLLKIFGKTKLDFGDFFIPWQNVTLRYVHYFTVSGLRKIIRKADFKFKKIGVIKGSKSKESNIYLIAEK